MCRLKVKHLGHDYHVLLYLFNSILGAKVTVNIYLWQIYIYSEGQSSNM